MTVVARVAAYPDRDFTGKITAVNPSVDPNSRVFILEARFDNPKGELRPGMFATARVLLPGGESAVFVPRNAVVRDKTTDSYQLFTIENNTARLHVVVHRRSRWRPDPHRQRTRPATRPSPPAAQSELFDGAPVQATAVQEVTHARTRPTLRPPSRLRDDADSVAGRGRHFFLLQPRRGSVPQGRHPHRGR